MYFLNNVATYFLPIFLHFLVLYLPTCIIPYMLCNELNCRLFRIRNLSRHCLYVHSLIVYYYVLLNNILCCVITRFFLVIRLPSLLKFYSLLQLRTKITLSLEE